MTRKYWVPAIERASLVLNLIAAEQGSLRLTDLSRALNINKSSMYSLLYTLETIGWIVKKKGDTYELGHALGSLSAAYFKQFNILQSFYSIAAKSSRKIQETIQLGVLHGNNVFYLGKEEGNSHVRIGTDPGMHFPAHASAIGKIQLTAYSYDELKKLYPNEAFVSRTPNTITNLDVLWKELEQARKQGYITESEEGTLGFYCVAAPVFNHENRLIAGVSFSMIESSWKTKQEEATKEIIQLALQLSQLAGQP